jgi:Ca2+-binding RTX toxin-like protein
VTPGNRLRGQGGDDVIRAGDGNDRVRGGEGADILDGGNGSDRLEYINDTVGVTVDLSANTASGGNAEGDTIVNFESITGGEGDDRLTGDSNANRLDGRGGINILVGGGGNDTFIDTTLETTGAGGIFATSGEDLNILSYSSATAGIVVGESSTTSRLFATDGLGGTDTIIHADRIIGSSNDDVFTITDNWNGSGRSGFDSSGVGQPNTNSFISIRGAGGNDTITGNGVTGIDLSDDSSGVTVVFSAEGNGTATGGSIGTDTFTGVNNIRGSSFDDTLTGGAGNQTLRGQAGNDTIDGGAGTNDRADYFNSDSSVTVDLAGGTAQDGFGDTDTLINIEDVRGSNDFGDLLIGDGNANTLSGLGGDDMLVGASGDDSLNGGLGADFLLGGLGVDTLTGGADSDIFQYIATADSGIGAARDTITDFDALNESEVIFLDGLLSGTFQAGISAGGNTGFTATTSGSDTQVLIDTDGDNTADMEILLTGVTATDVDITDFLVT